MSDDTRFDPTRLEVPIIGAPMAGGPSTPELVAAVNAAGGLGFLAAGYLSVAGLAEKIEITRGVTDRPFGVNLFVPQQVPVDADRFAAYRRELQPIAARYGVDLAAEPRHSDDDFDAKVDLLEAEPVEVVSLTFGCPSPAVRRLQAVGTMVIATVTSTAEADAAAAAGVDALCVQGPDAGGHRATFATDDEPGTESLDSLLATIGARTELPLIAAGGVGDADRIAQLLAAGAVAVQLGTLLLRTHEAGTKPSHANALTDPRFDTTVVTRAFSGRPARALANHFTEAHSASAPPYYPQVHYLTSPLRAAAAAAADPEALNLWAGAGHANAVAAPAGKVIGDLWAAARD